LASTRTARVVKLRSPFNGEVFAMEFLPGVPPTLEAMRACDFVVVEDDPKKSRKEDRT
jgi:hypothetical protein